MRLRMSAAVCARGALGQTTARFAPPPRSISPFGAAGGSLEIDVTLTTDVSIRRLTTLDDRALHDLTDVLLDCVAGGASVGFVEPLSRERAERFWRGVADKVARGGRAILVAEDDQGICGTVQLDVDLPDNQTHRADVCKMLVHRRARRRGLGARLMREVESLARALGRSVLVLDTVTDSDAHRLYTRLGWTRVGDVPAFAVFPDRTPCSTTYFYRHL